DIILVFHIVKLPSYHYFTISGIEEFNFTIVIEFIIQSGEIGLILHFFLKLFLNFLVVYFHIPQGLVTIPSNGVNILIGFAILIMNQNRKSFSPASILVFHILIHNSYPKFIPLDDITHLHVRIHPFRPANLSITDLKISHVLPPFLDMTGLLG